MYKNVILDFNGTLIDDCDLCLDILNIICKEHNLPSVTKRKYKSIFTFPVYLYYVECGFKVDDESFAKVGNRFHEIYNARSYSEVKLFKDVIKTLDTLKEKGVNLICISASMETTLVKQLKHYDIYKYFTNVIGLKDQFARSKEEVAIEFMNSNNLKKDETIFVGDSIHDKEVADAIGVESYLVSTGHTAKNRLLKVTNNVIDKLSEILTKIN